MKKRVLSMFMALALCLTLLPVSPAWAKEADAPEGGITTVSEQGGTNEEENGAEGGQQNTGTPDAGGAEDSKADAPESGEDENAGNNADAQSGVHTHCVCGGNGDVNGHKHDTAGTEWTTTDSLPNSAGSYYLTQSVSGGWTVPEGEVNLCLNGQTIDGSIKVGSGATLTLTDCSGNGKVQGEVTVNGGKFELYGGTIIGGVEVGRHSNPATGSAFTMYGGTISGNTDTGGVFLVGTTNQTDPPNFTMHGGTISNNTAGASDGGGGGVYVGEKCSFTMDGGTITGNTATAGNGGGIYIHFNAGNVSISNATITGNKASATGNTSYGHGGGIYSQRGVTVKNVTITGNNSTYEGGGIYGKGAITLTDATVTDNSQYDVYYDGQESTTPELTVSGSVKAGYYANFDWKLPILVSGELSENSVIHVGVREGIEHGAIAEPASGVTLRAENFKADAADCVTSLGDDGKVYLVPCTHEMDDTGYTCKKCHTQFDARVGDSAYYQTLTKAFDAARGSTVTLLRDVTLTGNCSSDTYSATLDLNGKTVSSDRYYICVGGGNKPNTLTVKDSGTGGGTQALTVKFLVYSNGTLAVDNSYTGKISRVELQAGGALERFGGEIGELVLSNAAHGSTSTGYGLKLWKGNTNACTIGGFTDNTTSKSLTVNDLLGTAYAKCELYGEKDGTWSIVDKSTKIAELTGYTAYKVQFPECVHQCADDSNPVCSVCHKKLYTKITAKAADGTTKTAYFTEDSALENGYVEAIQTLNGWSNEGCTEPTLTLLRDMYAYGTSMPLTGTLTLKGGTHTAKNVTVAKNADVTFASGSYKGATIDGTATVKEGVTFTDASVEVNGTLNAKGGTFTGNVKFNGSSIANISGGSFNNEKKYGGVTFDYNVTGTITGGTFTFADFYTTKVKLSGGTFTMIKTNGDRKLADLLAEGAAYYGASDNQAVTNDSVNTLENVKVVSHTHNGGADSKGICSICGKQMTASLTVGDKTSWYAAFATAIEAANAADGEKTITLYQDVNGYADGHSTTYELTHGPVTLATGGKTVTRVVLIAKGISLTVTGSNGSFYVTVDGKDAELTVNDKDTKLAIVTAQNGGKLSLSNGTFSRVAVKDDGSSASLSGGSYGEITSDPGYVKPYALLAKGYAYKDTKEDKWLPNANSISSKVTVEKAPFAVEKIYPNNDTGYTGNSAFATDGNITLTAVIAPEPETENVTYYYRWELFNESENDWTTRFKKVNTATHTGEKSKTLTISGLPVDKSYQYHIFVQCSNGYNCYSEPFTVSQHQHSWTYTASGATITASCTDTTCTSPNGGSVTINAPAADTLTYNGKQKAATVTSSDWKGVAIDTIAVAYAQNGNTLPSAPTDAGKYTASITVGEGNKAATASVKYTIQKANPVVTDWPTLSAPVYVNSEATLTGGSGEGTFAFKADAAKSWDSAGSKTTTIVFTPTDTNNYNELTQDCPVTVVKRTVKNCNTLVGITDKPCGTAQDELGLPGTVTITTVDGKTFNDIPVTWSGYDPNTLKEQTLTGTLDLTSIAGEVEQPSTPVAAQIKVKLTQKHFSGISPEAYDGVYDGKAHGITLTGVPSGATVKYGPSANSCTQDSLTYTNFTNGAKIVYYKVSKSGYADASGSAWVNITKRPLTVTGITANDKAYDGNTNVVLDYSAVTLVGVLKNDTLTVTATGTLESAGVGKQKVTISDLTLSGDSAANYVLAKSGNQSETTANITAREVTVTITPNGGTYGSVVAAAAKLTGAVDGKNVPVTLTYTGNGYNDTAVPINAGSYTVTASIANSNYTLTGNTTATFVITPKAVTVTGITAKDKVYDGTKNADISSVTFDGVTLNQGTDYNVTASFEDAGVGSGKNVTATVTLIGQAAQNYALEQSSFPTTGSITKAAAPDFTKETALAIINGYKKTYTVTLPTLPTLEKPKEYGAPTYELGEIKLNDGYYTGGAKVENGELTLPIQKNDVETTGSVGTVTVVIKSANYEDITLTVNVSAKNRITPTGTPTLSKNAIIYGDALNTIALSGKLHDNVNNVDVDGTFEWVDGTHIPVVGNGTYAAEWIFEPTDTEKYLTVSGRSNITVEKARQYGKLSMAGYTYGQTPSTPTLTNRTGDANAQVTYRYSAAGSGSVQTWDIQNPPALNAGTYRMYASIGDTDNYYGFEAAYCEFVVAKATPTYTAPTGLTAKYGQTLADVTLPDGWSWTDSSESVGGASTAAKTFQAKFTPKDTENYNTVENIGLEVMVNKADGGSLKTVDLTQKYTDISEHTYTPDWLELPSGQTWSYTSEYSVSTGSGAALTQHDFAADGSLLTYAVSGGKAGDKITITLKSSCNNYEDFTITLTITLTEKDNQQALRITGGTTVVYGQTLQLGTSGGSGSGAVTYTVTNGTGEATIDATGKLTPVKVGTVKVKVTKAADASFNEATSTEVEITITRATPTGAPKYTAITTSGKTLADAGLTVTGSTLNPNAGTLVWVDNAGNVLPGTTAVAANTTYKWLFTPTDANYTTLTGSIELYHKSSSSGGWYYTYYTIKATAGTNGSISPSGWTSVRDGWDQTFTITPDKGYAVAKVLVDGKSVGAVKSYTFKNVTKDHTIEAIFMKSNGNPQTGVFVDVAEGSYYEEAIDWAVEKGITNGVSSNMFAPNDPCTRAQIVTFLWRAAGSPAPKSMSSFTDVPADAFYAKAVAWAVENGITSGTGESKFSPNSTCTRAQAVTFLYRASGSPAVSGKAEFSDVSTTAFYADAVAWAAKKGITTGIGGGLFGSDNDCTRGQIVTFLWRAMAE